MGHRSVALLELDVAGPCAPRSRRIAGLGAAGHPGDRAGGSGRARRVVRSVVRRMLRGSPPAHPPRRGILPRRRAGDDDAGHPQYAAAGHPGAPARLDEASSAQRSDRSPPERVPPCAPGGTASRDRDGLVPGITRRAAASGTRSAGQASGGRRRPARSSHRKGPNSRGNGRRGRDLRRCGPRTDTEGVEPAARLDAGGAS